jgi:hypothetical protein
MSISKMGKLNFGILHLLALLVKFISETTKYRRNMSTYNRKYSGESIQRKKTA